jgi:hypothetical protein
MDGYNMEKSKENQSIFNKESIQAFLKVLKKWIGYRKLKLYYYGSYFYDIEGHLAVSENNEVWPPEQLDENQKKLKSSFSKEGFWNESISITESIQNQYLNLFQQVDPGNIDILHIFRDSDSDKCETINALTSSTSPIELTAFILTNDDSIKNKIKNSFKNHFELIKDSGSHIYFFPTVLRLKNKTKVINVTTIISPTELNAKEIYYIKGGLSFCSEGLISDTINYLSDKALLEAIKSVVAALMARNMSHNLGSHPLTNTKNYFRKRIDEVISEDRYNCEDVGADYRGNVHLLQYIKERMDFIATVVSSDQYPFGALNFKAQLFDVLTEDDHGQRHKKRTQNFLLKYLVFSEKLTRYTLDMPENYKEVLLKVIYDGETYTGDVDEEENEKSIKLALSNLELAVPGGLMGRHAFFCIIENIARNSAKHSKKDEDLVITIKMKPNKDKTKMDISIFDNREGGRKVKNEIEEHLKELVILNEENNRVDKNSKGLKEMLICALWLRNENVAEKLYEIQSEKDGERKIDQIKKYLDVSLVDNKGEKKDNEGNLCYTIKNIPLFETCHQLKENEDYQTEDNDGIRLVEAKVVNLHADIVAADKDYLVFVKDNKEERRLSDIFPRFVDLSKFNKEEKEKWDEAYQAKDSKILFKMFDENSNAKLLKKNPTIHTDSDGIVEQIDSDDTININVKKGNITDSDWTIFFKNHLESDVPAKVKQDVIDKGEGKYLESESGENFTSTITTNDFLEDTVNRYKVVEAANTHIAIIDERIYGDFQTRWIGDVGLEQKLLEMRGIYLLNFDKENENKIIDLQGNEFNMNKNINFVSIHLGLLDKYKKKVNIREDILDKYFGEKTFVSIHSGRGNFSADLESELKNYPFISLSALEAAFYDCKYFLTQLFKTTNYYGKGNITDK